MGRVIYADRLKEELPEFLNPNHRENGKFNQGWNACLNEIYDILKNQPTAYDVDAVVDELYSSSDKGVFKPCDFSGLIGSMSYKGGFISTENAASIVKRGGVE